MGKNRKLINKLASLFFLLVMTTLLVGKSVHSYSHFPHLHIFCSHSSDIADNQQSEQNPHHDSHNCSICNFSFSALGLTSTQLLSFAVFLTFIFTVCLGSELHIYFRESKSRAPPAQAIS